MNVEVNDVIGPYEVLLRELAVERANLMAQVRALQEQLEQARGGGQ